MWYIKILNNLQFNMKNSRITLSILDQEQGGNIGSVNREIVLQSDYGGFKGRNIQPGRKPNGKLTISG